MVWLHAHCFTIRKLKISGMDWTVEPFLLLSLSVSFSLDRCNRKLPSFLEWFVMLHPSVKRVASATKNITELKELVFVLVDSWWCLYLFELVSAATVLPNIRSSLKREFWASVFWNSYPDNVSASVRYPWLILLHMKFHPDYVLFTDWGFWTFRIKKCFEFSISLAWWVWNFMYSY